MNLEHCKNLDAYLDQSLNQDLRLAFQQHLEFCDECRQEVELDCGLDLSIRESWLQIEIPECWVKPNIVSATSGESNRFGWIAAALAIAATISLLASLAILFSQTTGEPTTITGAGEPKIERPVSPVSFRNGNHDRSTILVPVETKNPNFTIVRAYSAMTAVDFKQ